MSKRELIDVYSLYKNDKAFQDRVEKFSTKYKMSAEQVLELLINHLPCKVFRRFDESEDK